MRVLTPVLTTLAMTAFAVGSAQACAWNKTAKAETNITVAETTATPWTDQTVAVGTNDLSDTVLAEETIRPVPTEKPAN